MKSLHAVWRPETCVSCRDAGRQHPQLQTTKSRETVRKMSSERVAGGYDIENAIKVSLE